MTIIQQTRPDANANASIPQPVLAAEPAYRIRDDKEAFETAHILAAEFAREAALRDRHHGDRQLLSQQRKSTAASLAVKPSMRA